MCVELCTKIHEKLLQSKSKPLILPNFQHEKHDAVTWILLRQTSCLERLSKKSEPAVLNSNSRLVQHLLIILGCYGCWSQRRIIKHCMLGTACVSGQNAASRREINRQLLVLPILTNSDKTCQASRGKLQLNLLKRRIRRGTPPGLLTGAVHKNKCVFVWMYRQI